VRYTDSTPKDDVCPFQTISIHYSIVAQVLPPRSNGLFLRCIIAVTLLVDTVGTAGINASVYLVCEIYSLDAWLTDYPGTLRLQHCVTHWGDVDYIITTEWPEEVFVSNHSIAISALAPAYSPVQISATGISTIICQLYLIRRFSVLLDRSHYSGSFILTTLSGRGGS
jgi:hypothetical protein